MLHKIAKIGGESLLKSSRKRSHFFTKYSQFSLLQQIVYHFCESAYNDMDWSQILYTIVDISYAWLEEWSHSK